VLEPSSGVRSGDLGERLLHGLQQGLVGACSYLPQDVLDLGEGLLDEPTAVRLYTLASSSGYTIIASLQLDPLPVSMVSAGQFMQPAEPLKLRLIGPYHPASSVTPQLPAAYPSTSDLRIQRLFRHSYPLG
jgi:hypothetical protein